MWLTADLYIFQNVSVGQCEASDVFGLSQITVQAVGEVHHVILSGVNLPECRAQRAASPLKVGLLSAPLLLQLCFLLLQRSVSTQLGTLRALVCILRPKTLSLLSQELGRKEFNSSLLAGCGD